MQAENAYMIVESVETITYIAKYVVKLLNYEFYDTFIDFGIISIRDKRSV